MPCHRCGARQSDPGRGPSPWRRGVAGGALVLVCPDCQAGRDWAGDLDRCAACGSTMLVRELGRTRCRACGREQPEAPLPAGGPAPDGAPAPAGDLAREVADAVRRVLGEGGGPGRGYPRPGPVAQR